MCRRLLLACTVAALLSAAVRTQGDAAAVLAAARQALGGDAALNNVTTLTVFGSARIDPGPVRISESVEISLALPDKFVRYTQRSMSIGPLGSADIEEWHGFNADDIIDDNRSTGPIPMPVIEQTGSPAQLAARRAQRVVGMKRSAMELTLPLFASSFSTYPLTFMALGSVAGPRGPADAVEGKAPDGFTVRLYLHPTTHLPSAIVWMGRPVVGGFSVSSPMAVSSRGQVVTPPGSAMLPADPTAGMADVEWQLLLDDYRSEAGLTWPRKLTKTVSGKTYEELTIRKFSINPKLKPGVFKATK